MLNLALAFLLVFTTISCKNVDSSIISQNPPKENTIDTDTLNMISEVSPETIVNNHLETPVTVRKATQSSKVVNNEDVLSEKSKSTKVVETPTSKVDRTEAKVNVDKNTYEKTTLPGEEEIKEIVKNEKTVTLEDKVRENTPKEESEVIEKPQNTYKEEMNVTKMDHTNFDSLLKKYVSKDGKVNYKGIKSDENKLNTYLGELEASNIDANWTKSEKLAFWINAYNAFTIKLIVSNYPLKSITELSNGKPWDKVWIIIAGKQLSLNNIENDIIRPQFKEAKIHFAVNCAAKSCPSLLNQAFTGSNVHSLLTSQTKKFLANTAFNNIQVDKIEISKIFEWYAQDFGDIIEFVNQYSTIKVDKNAKISYKEYDWNLNE